MSFDKSLLDDAILARVRGGDSAVVVFGDDAMGVQLRAYEAETGREAGAMLERRLTQLRKRNLITYSRKTGWQPVQAA